MRLRRRAAREEPPPERPSLEDIDRISPDVERRSFPPGPLTPAPVPEMPTAAERAAARRRLDRLAEEF
jgi:hypothetical protein